MFCGILSGKFTIVSHVLTLKYTCGYFGLLLIHFLDCLSFIDFEMNDIWPAPEIVDIISLLIDAI